MAGRSAATAMWKGWDDPAAAADTDWSDPESLQVSRLVSSGEWTQHRGNRVACESWRVTPFRLLACMSLQGLGLVAERSFFPHYDPQWAELVRSRHGAI